MVKQTIKTEKRLERDIVGKTIVKRDWERYN